MKLVFSIITLAVYVHSVVQKCLSDFFDLYRNSAAQLLTIRRSWVVDPLVVVVEGSTARMEIKVQCQVLNAITQEFLSLEVANISPLR